ncbi:hypothetical protein EON81_16900 [bacterium]|nr:MAG: hypothetical protein EON81_16900 [bacterium]
MKGIPEGASVPNGTGGKPPEAKKPKRTRKTDSDDDGETHLVNGPLAESPPGPGAAPFARACWTLRKAHEACELSTVVVADVRRMLRPDTPVQVLIDLYGEEVAARMFVWAWTNWTKKPTWPSLCDKRDKTRDEMEAASKPTTPVLSDREKQEADAKRRREEATAAEVTRQREAEEAEFNRRRSTGLISSPVREIPEPFQAGDSFR